jgi:hypothetical protein
VVNLQYSLPDNLLYNRADITIRVEAGAWLSAVGWKEFCPFGLEESCQLLSIRLSTAVTMAAYIEHSFEDIRGLSGNYKEKHELFR